MVFDRSFTAIISGRVASAAEPNDQQQNWEEMSVFGQNLVYVNAAAERRFAALLVAADENAATEAARQDRSQLQESESAMPEREGSALPDPNSSPPQPGSNEHEHARQELLRQQLLARQQAVLTVEQELSGAGATPRTLSLLRLLWQRVQIEREMAVVETSGQEQSIESLREPLLSP